MKYDFGAPRLQVVYWLLGILVALAVLQPIVTPFLPWSVRADARATREHLVYVETRIDSIEVREFHRNLLAELTAICVVEPKHSDQWERAAAAMRAMRTVHFDREGGVR